MDYGFKYVKETSNQIDIETALGLPATVDGLEGYEGGNRFIFPWRKPFSTIERLWLKSVQLTDISPCNVRT